MGIEERLSKLERRFGATVAALGLAVVVLGGLAAYQGWRIAALQSPASLRVRELRVYDEKGVDRVVLGGQLPQVTLDGKPHFTHRRDMAGMLIYDQSGTERGGYGTADGYANALITLDAKDHQVFMALAEPDGGIFMRQWEGKGSITSGVGDKPYFTMKDDKTVIFAKPEDNPWVKREMR